MLSLAAKEADIVSINPLSTEGGMDLSTLTAGLFAEKVAWVREVAGERFNAIQLHAMIFWIIETDDQEQAAMQWIQQAENHNLRRGKSIATGPRAFTIEDVLTSPYILIGTREQMVAELQARRQRYGVSYFTTASGIGQDIFGLIVEQLANK
jgi:hypothetical protein